MRDRTRNEKIFEQMNGADAKNSFSPGYKHQPTSPRVLIVEAKRTPLSLLDGLNEHGEKVPLVGVTTSPAAVGDSTLSNGVTILGMANPGPYPHPIDLEGLTPLAQADEAEVFGELTRENKFWVLQALGFKPTGPGRWWHHALSEVETFDNIEFDIDNDDLPKLVTILVLQGIRRGNHHIRQTIKSALGI